jgi:pimeloyl-ACP methyl ester carboxylesterase
MIAVNNLSFHYLQSGQGPDVVFVHGLGGNLAGWHLHVVPALQSDYRVTTYDLRGHGRSDSTQAGYTTSEMAEDLRGLLDALGLERPTIVGHSWGGDIALHFSLLHPERVAELVILEGGLLAPLAGVYRSHEWGGWPYATATIEQLLNRPIPDEHKFDLDFLLRQLIEIPIRYGPSRGKPRSEELVLRVMDILRPMWEGHEADGNMSLESLERVTPPALLVYESNSAYMEAHDALRDRLPFSRSELLPGGPIKHFTTLEHPDLVVSAIRRFLAELRAVRQDAAIPS